MNNLEVKDRLYCAKYNIEYACELLRKARYGSDIARALDYLESVTTELNIIMKTFKD